MGLIHHHQVPTGGNSIRLGLFAGHQEIQAAQCKLFTLKRVFIGIGQVVILFRPPLQILHGLIPAAINDRESQVEPPQHFHQPLMHQ